jgi:hypothetical protein
MEIIAPTFSGKKVIKIDSVWKLVTDAGEMFFYSFLKK